MALNVTVERVIQQPRERVAAFASDPANDTTWIKNIKEVEWLNEPPVRVGTRVSRVAHFLGKRLAYTYRVDSLDPGRELSMSAEEAPFPMTTTYRFEDATGEHGPACRVTLEVGGGPGGFFGLATPLLAMQMRRALTKDLACLADALEARTD